MRAPRRIAHRLGVGLPALCLFGGVATGCLSRAADPAAAQRVENFALLDHRGDFHELYYYGDATAIVLYVQGNDCPIVRDSLPALRRAAERFEDAVFLMINANPQDGRRAIAEEARAFDIDFPILVDEAQLIAESLDIRRTAEALVIDPSTWRLVYRGPIDDRRGYGSRPGTVSRRYLEEALAALMASEPVRIEAPEPQGCLITRPGGAAEISYVRNVAPILLERCAPCHREGGIAPWAMDRHATVLGWSRMMREVVRTRRMPPWHADPEIGDFANDLSLSRHERSTLVRWIESGAPRGEGADPLLAASEPVAAGWPLGPPDLLLEIEPQPIPSNGIVPYRYAQLDVPLERDVWVRAAHLAPSNAKVLHHAIVFLRSPGDPDAEGEAESAGAGRRAARRAHLPFYRRIFTKYNPGLGADEFPPGTARRLPAGSKLRIQLHYTPTGRPEVDAPRLALYFADAPPERQLEVTAAINTGFRIPPHAARHEVRASWTFDRDVLLYSMQPHMHFRGRSMRFEARFPDGRRETLLSVPRYDFDFQSFYDLREPRLLPAGTIVECRGTYDNSARNEANPDPSREVEWGAQSGDEMFIGYLVYAETSEPSPPREAR